MKFHLIKSFILKIFILFGIIAMLIGGKYYLDMTQNEKKGESKDCVDSPHKIIRCNESLTTQQRYLRYFNYSENRISMDSYHLRRIDLDSFYQQFKIVYNECLANLDCNVQDGGAKLNKFRKECIERGFEYCSEEAIRNPENQKDDRMIIFKRAVIRQDKSFMVNACRLSLLDFYKSLPENEKNSLHPTIRERCERRISMQSGVNTKNDTQDNNISE